MYNAGVGVAHYNLKYTERKKKKTKPQATCAVLASSVLRALQVKLTIWGLLQNVAL